jgi:hypothetical protein
MTDPTQPTTTQTTDDNDPLQVSCIISESNAVHNEANSVEILAQSFEVYVTHYTEAFTETWENVMQAYQGDVDQQQVEYAEIQAPVTPPSTANGADIISQQLQTLKDHLASLVGGADQPSDPPETTAEPAEKSSA